jgi:transcriptional regulator with XRE-family HTH domain
MVTRIGPKHAFQHFIQEWRDERGLTQEQLANRVETTKASISRWETGERDPTMKVLAAIADALSIDIADIFRDPKRPSADQLLRHQSQATQEKAVELVKVYLKVS